MNIAICELLLDIASNWTVFCKCHMDSKDISLHTKVLDPKLGDFILAANTAVMI